MDKELIALAERYARDMISKTGEEKFSQFFNEKFADLIVDKCAEAAEEYWNDASLQKACSISEYIYAVMG